MKQLKQTFLVIVLMMILMNVGWGQTTYTWKVTSGSWTTAANWTPSRTTPATNDILVFNGSTQATPTVTGIPSQTIGALIIQNNSSVTFSTGESVTCTGSIEQTDTVVTGTSTLFMTELASGDHFYTSPSGNVFSVKTITDDTHLTTFESGSIIGGTSMYIAPLLKIASTSNGLSVGSGSSLTVSGTSPIIITLASSVPGTINGNVTFTSASHGLTSASASGISFKSGSIFTAGTSFSGNAFGTGGGGTNGALISVIFENGSTYISRAGDDPFGAAAPNSVVVFQSGSLYSHQQNSAPSFSGRTFANFEINFAAYSQTSTGTSASSFNNFTVTAGIQNYNLTGAINIKGNIIVGAGGTLNFAPPSAGTVNLNGTSAQTITNNGTLTFGSFSTINLNNSNGLVLGSTVSFNNLTMTSGKLTLGAYNITANAVSGGSSTAYVVTNGAGTLTINNIGSTIKLFPIGTTTSYNPASIINAGTVDNFSVKVGTTLSGSYDPTKVVLRQWDVAEGTSGSSNVTLKLQFNNGEYGSNFLPGGTVVMGHYVSNVWMQLSGVVSGSNPYVLTTSGITSLSPFSVAMQGALPVTLSSLNSVVVGRNIKLNWATATETNNSGFEVERNNIIDNNWSNIAFISGHGTVNTPTNYTFEDRNLQTGKYKYRLKQIDVNGNFEYFALNGEVEIGVPKKFDLSQNYPNPFNPTTKIDFDLPFDSKVNIVIYDVTGRETAKLVNNEFKKAGYYITDFNASSFSSGVYFYRIIVRHGGSADKDFVATKKMLLLK